MNNKKISEILSAFKYDLQEAETAHDAQMAKIEQYRSVYNAELYGNEEDGKSKIVSKDARRQSEWLYASLMAPFMDSDIIKSKPVTWEDEAIARQTELVINTQFTRRFHRYNFLKKAIKVYDRDGTVVVQSGWDYKTKEVTTEQAVIGIDEYTGEEYIAGVEEITEEVATVNAPVGLVRRNEDVFVDPTCEDDMDRCQFVIVRYKSNLSTLKGDARLKNVDRIKKSIDDSGPDSDYDYESEDDSSFQFEDDPRKELLVYEYWGNYDIDGDGIAESIVCTWVNDTVIRLEGNPYPGKQIPFVVTSANSIPFEMYGEANAALIADSQQVKTAVLRGMINNMAQSNNGQVITKKGALDTKNRKRMNQNKSFEVNTNLGDVKVGGFNQLSGSAFDMLGVADRDIESITGVMGMNEKGLGGGIGGSARGAGGVLDSISTRRLNTVRNLAENLIKPIVRKWISYNNEFLSPEEVTRITNAEYVEIDPDDVGAKLDIEIEVSTVEDNALKADKIAFMIQTLGPSMEPDALADMTSTYYELVKMPREAQRERDRADKIREQMSKPDPMAEEAKRQELRAMTLANDKLEAEIIELQANAGESDGDKAEKFAKARLIMAQREKLMAETELTKEKTDVEALNYLKKDHGIDHLERLELEDKKGKAKLDMESMKLRANMLQMQYQKHNGGPNEQIGVYNG